MSSLAHKLIEERPWERPWWKPSKGNFSTFAYIIVTHILAVTGLVLFPLPSWPVAIVSLILAILGGIGTSVCYHRSLSHGALKLHPIVEHALIFFSIFNGNGSPQTWVANHRQHHAKADTIEDVSSPRHGGFWWAHLRWIYQWPQSEVRRWCPNLDTPAYRLWNKLLTPIIAVSMVIGLLWSWPAFFWLGAIRHVYSLHFQMLVNSVLHMSPGVPAGQDSSRNIWWLGPFQLGAWGENWHHNHHNEATSAKFSRQWFQIDVGWYFIWTMEKLGLAWNVRRPKQSS
jgi:fatty-acid desaturase